MANPLRIQRLSSLILRRVAEVIEHDLSDPRSEGISVTRVKLAKDLSTCKVFYSCLGDEGRLSAVQHMLQHARGFIQREVGAVLRTRVVPRLAFVFDPSIKGAIELSSAIDAALARDRANHPEEALENADEERPGEVEEGEDEVLEEPAREEDQTL